jgi:sugar-phosphatase
MLARLGHASGETHVSHAPILQNTFGRHPGPYNRTVHGGVFDVKGLLFDFDGVLADSNAAVIRHWTAFAQRHGLDPESVLHGAHGVRGVETIATLRETYKLTYDVAAEFAWFEKLEVEEAADVTALPGAAELLVSLPVEKWGIYTACTRNLILGRLNGAGLPIPRVLVTADDVTSGKPNPEGYRKLAQELNFDPRDCVVLEDAPAGVEAGLGAGCSVIALATTHAPERLSHADVVIPDLRSLGAKMVGELIQVTVDLPRA